MPLVLVRRMIPGHIFGGVTTTLPEKFTVISRVPVMLTQFSNGSGSLPANISIRLSFGS
jgi:hypothetical protein